MKKCITDYLEESKNKFKDKIVFIEKNRQITYNDFVIESKKVATSILKYNLYNKPIVIFIDKTINALSSMIGVTYSANFYTVIDTNMPKNRIENIFDRLKPMLIITDNKNYEKLKRYNFNIETLIFEDTQEKEIDENKVKEAYDNRINA